MSLEDLYREIILDHYRNPRNRGELEVPPAHKVEGFNPLCGDEIVVYLDLDGDTVRDIRIAGQGCSISQSSASMMSAAVKGRTATEARGLIRAFKAMMSIHERGLDSNGDGFDGEGGPVEPDPSVDMGELEALRGRVQYTVRVRYEQDAVLREVLAASPEIEQLRTPDDVDGGSFDRRLRLGELVVKALEQLRPADAEAVLQQLGDTVDVRVRQTSSPDDVLDVAFLVDSTESADFERRVEAVGRDHHDRLRIRLIGPSPAYDFVGSG